MKKETKQKAKEEKKQEPKKEIQPKDQSPLGLKIISFLYFIGAFLLLLTAIFLVAASSVLAQVAGSVTFAGLFLSAIQGAKAILYFVGGITLILSVVTLVIGWALWKNKKWSKVLVLIFSVLGILSAIYGFIKGAFITSGVNILMNAAIIFYLLKLDYLPKKKKEEKETANPQKVPQKKKERNFEKDLKKFAPLMFLFFLLIGALIYFLTRNVANSILTFIAPSILLGLYLILRDRLKRYNDLKQMEAVFPDFISLMASNLRAGMTVDRALLLSSRKEFAPLDKEIILVGKDILTAREITLALESMAKRIGSDEIKKTVQIIVSGLRSGGNLSVILEETASNMRERMFVQKRAASNVLMYVIFIFFAVAVGAPLLFGLSNVLVEVMTGIFSDVSASQTTNSNLPFSFSEVNVSTEFIFYFSLSFIVAMCLMASLMLGLVSKGKEREGLKYIIPLLIISVTVFLISRIFLLKNFSGIT